MATEIHSIGNFTEGNFTEVELSSVRNLLRIMRTYMSPVYLLIGFGGNITSSVVFLVTYIRLRSFSIFLAALSIADSIFLLCLLLSWSSHIGLEFFSHDGWCQLLIFLTSLSSFLSKLYVVVFTLDLFIATHLRSRKLNLCSSKYAKLVVSLCAVLAAVLYNYLTWTTGISTYMGTQVCGPLKKYSRAVSIMDDIDTIVIFDMLVGILGLNINILYETNKTTKASRNGNYQNRRKQNGENQEALCMQSQLQIIKLLVTTSSIILLLNIPRQTLHFYVTVRRYLATDFIPDEISMLVNSCLDLVYHFKFCINLVLFSTISKTFRRASRWLIGKVEHNFDRFKNSPGSAHRLQDVDLRGGNVLNLGAAEIELMSLASPRL